MQRRERLYLQDIVEAADDLDRIIAGLVFETFVASDVVRSAVLWKLTTIGEAAAHVAVDTRAKHPEIPWSRIVAFRNIVVHKYFGIDWEIVWEAAARNVPALRERVNAMLADDDPEDVEQN